MKKSLSILCIAVIMLSCFCACSGGKPEEPATSSVSKVTVIDGIKKYAPSTEKEPTIVDRKDVTEAPSIRTDTTKTLVRSDVEITLSDYYVYNKSYVKIKDFELTDFGVGSIEGYAKLELTSLGFGEKQVRVGLLYLDENGKTVKTSFILADIKNGGYKEGDVVDCRFDIDESLHASKLVFVDYSAVSAEINF